MYTRTFYNTMSCLCLAASPCGVFCITYINMCVYVIKASHHCLSEDFSQEKDSVAIF